MSRIKSTRDFTYSHTHTHTHTYTHTNTPIAGSISTYGGDGGRRRGGGGGGSMLSYKGETKPWSI